MDVFLLIHLEKRLILLRIKFINVTFKLIFLNILNYLKKCFVIFSSVISFIQCILNIKLFKKKKKMEDYNRINVISNHESPLERSVVLASLFNIKKFWVDKQKNHKC